MLFTFPSRYWYTIGLSRVFSLAGWTRPIHAGLHVSRATQGTAMLRLASCTGLSPALAGLSRPFHSQDACNVAALLPQRGRNLAGLGCAPFARHYWGYHCCFLFLRVLRCFSSPGSPPASAGYQVFNLVGCPIRRSRDQRPFAPTPGLSQLITSFIACESLGIRHTPFSTFARTGLALGKPG